MRTHFRRSEILSNIVNIGLGDLGSRVIAFATFIYVARVLGPEKLGLIGFGASTVALAVPFVDYGLGFVGTREVSRNPASLRFYIKTILFDRLVLGIVALVLFAAVAELFFDDPEKVRILLLYSLTLLPVVVTLTWAYQGIGETGWFTFEKNVQAVLYLAAVLVFVHWPGDVYRIPVAYTVAALVPAGIVLLYYTRRTGKTEGTFSAGSSFKLLRSSFRLFIPTLLSQINVPIGLLLVVYFSSLQEAGYFSAASKIILLAAALPNLLWSSFYPVLSRSLIRDPKEMQHTGGVLYKYAVVIGVLPAFFGLMFPHEIVNLLFGPSYQEAVVPFELFSVVASLQFLSIVFTRILPALGLDKSFSRIVTGGVVVQLAAGLALIPRYGASGAAFSFILAEGVMATAAMMIVRRLIRARFVPEPAVSVLFLLLCYFIVMEIRTLTDIPLLVCLIAIAVLYILLLLATSSISLKDFAYGYAGAGEVR